MGNKRGFTLLETLLAVLLMSIGFVVLLQFLGTGLFAGSENENDLVALHLAQEKVEELRNKSYASVANETKAAVSGFPVFQREVVITTPVANLKQATINVYWNSKSNELHTTLVTYVSNI